VDAVTVMVAVAAIVLAVVLLQPTRSTEPIRTEDPLSLALTAGEPVAFTSDAPVEVTLSVGAPADVDLTSDAVPDAVITLTSTDGGSAHLALASPTAAIWDETGFTTSGGTRPYDHHNNAADEDLTVVPDTAGPEGGFLLLHVSGDGRVTSVDAALLGSGGADVAGREQDTALDAALDPASGTLVIASFHRTAGEQHDGPADGGQQLHVVTVAADDGAATRVWDGPTASGSPRAQVTHPMELVPVDEGLALALYDAHAKPDAPSGSADRGRFVLWPWDGSGDTPGWGAGAVVLDGGKPVLADVRIGLNAFAQTPTRAICGAPVALRGAVPVAGATVAITNPAGDVVASPPVSAGGTFEPVELPAKPPTTYTVTVSGNGLTIDEDVRLLGGDDLFMTYGLVPGRGDLRIRSATEGYTSWMVKAGWPGLGEIAGADMYVWYGNYAITVGAEYWDGTDELAAVDVTVLGRHVRDARDGVGDRLLRMVRAAGRGHRLGRHGLGGHSRDTRDPAHGRPARARRGHLRALRRLRRRRRVDRDRPGQRAPHLGGGPERLRATPGVRLLRPARVHVQRDRGGAAGLRDPDRHRGVQRAADRGARGPGGRVPPRAAAG